VIKSMRRVLTMVLTIGLCLMTAAACLAAETGQPVIELDGENLAVPAEAADGTVFLPLRAVGEAVGFHIQWSGHAEPITASKPGTSFSVTVGSSAAAVNGHEILLPESVKLVKDRAYIPASFFADYLGLRVDYDSAGSKIVARTIQENQVTTVNQKEELVTPELQLKIQYPQLQGLQDAAVQKKLNTAFQELAAQAEATGRENAAQLWPGEIDRQICAETYFDYVVKYNQDGLMSVVFSDYQYSGGAHGLTLQSALTFNLKTGAIYQLSDLFRDNVDYVELISQKVREQMRDRGLEPLIPFTSINPLEDFYLSSSDALVVYFQQYEYFPYALGIQEFAIPFSDLSDWLTPGILN
jgi:hypothetical protein